MNLGVSGLVVAQHLYRREIALQILLAMNTARVLIMRLLRARGMDAVRKMAALTPSPSSPALYRQAGVDLFFARFPPVLLSLAASRRSRGAIVPGAASRLIADVDPDPESSLRGILGVFPCE